jgi:hypothetical protein
LKQYHCKSPHELIEPDPFGFLNPNATTQSLKNLNKNKETKQYKNKHKKYKLGATTKSHDHHRKGGGCGGNRTNPQKETEVT